MEETIEMKDYQAPWIAQFLHAFPHIDLSFHRANSTFNLDNAKYKEVRKIY